MFTDVRPPSSSMLLAWFSLRPPKKIQYLPPKRLKTSTRFHGITYLKILLFESIGSKCSDSSNKEPLNIASNIMNLIKTKGKFIPELN
jgi:hypothetical protein